MDRIAGRVAEADISIMNATGRPGRFRIDHASRVFTAACACALALALPIETRAQETPDPEADARLLIGPVYLNPTFAIRDFGTDSNVFNDSVKPVSDFSMTLNPEVTGGMRLGPARVGFGTSLGLVLFQTYTNQNSVNRLLHGRIDLPLGRISPFVGVEYLATRARPGFEIDARAHRTEPTIRAGTEVRLTNQTSLSLALRRTEVTFAEGEQFLGRDLGDSLNRHSQTGSAIVRMAVTPLTTIVVLSEVERTRFDVSSMRDSNGLRVASGFEFQPDALFRGSAFLGLRRFQALSPEIPDYAGLAAAVSLVYTLRGTTKFEGRFDRDIAYSLEEATPYYLSTGGSLTVTQQVVGPLDVTGTLAWQSLGYRAASDSIIQDRVDRVKVFGVGTGYRLGESVRLGINVERTDRRSNILLFRNYNRSRIFGSLTYGVQ